MGLTRIERQADLRRATQLALDTDAEVLYDVASAVGQIVGNVKHMRWFRVAVAWEIAGRHKKYAPLTEGGPSDISETCRSRG